MADQQIRFDDGAAYEKLMGVWSRLVGEQFLDWLALPPGLKCIDVGCGNGAFTELLIGRCKPMEVVGIDPAEGQIAFARTRPGVGVARFELGDAEALPVADKSFDVALMTLVIFFVPHPEKGLAEMKRATRPGGTIAAYAWDMLGGGFPLEPLQAELRAIGQNYMIPPSSAVSQMPALRKLWEDGGLEAVETRAFAVRRTFADFDELWSSFIASPSTGGAVAKLAAVDVTTVKARLRERLPADASGRITCGAFANAVKGRVPG
jgi:ubiquinone/menaquinone biosynthesis C-methylase UbiE